MKYALQFFFRDQCQMAEIIWYDSPHTLFTKETALKILPSSTMTYAEQLNAVVRLSVYYGVLVSIVKGSPDMLFVPVGVAFVTFLLYRSFVAQGRAEVFSQMSASGGGRGSSSASCVKPSKANPFMNVLNGDDPYRDAACDPLDPEIKKNVEDKFASSMFYDVDDVWSRNNSGRNFNTTPSTTVPNDQGNFAEWLYSGVRAGGKQTRPPRNAAY